MSWLSKLLSVSSNVVTEKAEKVLDNVVDIKREGGAIIRKIDGKVTTLRTRLTEAQTQVQMNKDEIKTLNQQVSLMNETAARAVKAGNDEDAIQALNRVELFTETINSLQQSNNILEPVIAQQLNYIQTLEAEKRSLETEIRRMAIEEKAYNLRADMLGGVDGTFGYNIDDLRKRVQKAKASVEAKEIISEKLGENVEKKYESAPRASIESKLEALKLQHGKSENTSE
ncbi:putative transcription regulation protein [Acinetobacter phage BS46]|nr:putative transcription regulation protein [Acinetobacter phage BS46]